MEELAIIFALLYASLTGLSIVIDRIILKDVLDHPGTFLITSTVTTLFLALGGSLVFPTVFTPSTELLAAFVVLGLFKSLPIYVYFRVLKTADASTVSPVISTQPALTVGLAFLVLGERLSMIEYGGVAVLLIGGLLLAASGLRDVLVSLLSPNQSHETRPVVIAFELALLWSVEAIFIKFVLKYTTFWTVFFWSSVFATVVALFFLFRDSVQRELTAVVTGQATDKLDALIASEFISSVAGAAMIGAYAYAPVSLVAPVLHTYSAFVFIYIVLLHWSGFSIDTDMSQPQILHKGLAVLLTVAGLILLSLGAVRVS